MTPRRLRGLLGIALLWAATWAVASLPLTAYTVGRLHAARVDAARLAALYTAWWALTGLVSGAGFALLLLAAERRRTVEALGAGRLALWGALAGLLLPAAMLGRSDVPTSGADAATLLTVFGAHVVLGALAAVLTLRSARRAPPGVGRGATGPAAVAPPPDAAPRLPSGAPTPAPPERASSTAGSPPRRLALHLER